MMSNQNIPDSVEFIRDDESELKRIGEIMDTRKEDIMVREDDLTPDEELKAEIGDDPKRKKYVALFQARTVLSKIGTMVERQTSRKQLKRMKKLGLQSV